MQNRQTKTLSKETTTGAVIGALAGGAAQVSVGFKEGVVGGALGGVLNRGLSYALEQTAGFSKMTAELAAFAITATLDAGGLHSFGSDKGPINGNPVIPYAPEEGLVLHHVVFYTAMLLGFAGVSLYNNRHALFGANTSKNPVVAPSDDAELTDKPVNKRRQS